MVTNERDTLLSSDFFFFGGGGSGGCGSGMERDIVFILENSTIDKHAGRIRRHKNGRV